MNDDELRRINTLDRYDADLNDWEAALMNATAEIDQAEITRHPSCYTEARKYIAGVLAEIQHARHFVSVKRASVEELISDVETLFDDGQSGKRLGALPEDRRWRDEGRPE